MAFPSILSRNLITYRHALRNCRVDIDSQSPSDCSRVVRRTLVRHTFLLQNQGDEGNDGVNAAEEGGRSSALH